MAGWFSRAAVTSTTSWKASIAKCTVSQFWRLEVWNQVPQGHAPCETCREKAPWLVLASGGCRQSWALLDLRLQPVIFFLRPHVAPLLTRLSVSLLLL